MEQPSQVSQLRSKEQILNDYSQYAAKAGDAEYKIKFLSKELAKFYAYMDKLNLEPAAAPEVPCVEQPEGEEHA
jgi:hypothetical protein